MGNVPQNNFCLPIIEQDIEKIPEIIKNQAGNYGFFEIWLDYLDKPDYKSIESLILQHPGKIVCLFRRLNLDAVKMELGKRQFMLKGLSSTNCFIDLDIGTQRDELEHLGSEARKCKLICSYHNYSSTPPLEELQKILESMDSYKPSVYKVACYCQNDGDALRLTELALAIKEKNKKFIVTGMGHYGKLTRVNAALLGSEMIFAPINLESSSAAGQITLSNFKQILESLK